MVIAVLLELLDAVLDAAVDAEGGALEGQLVVDPLDGAVEGRLDALGDAPRRRREVRDVALPPRRPRRRLVRQPLLRPRQHEVQRREAGHARGSERRDLRRPGLGYADGHLG